MCDCYSCLPDHLLIPQLEPDHLPAPKPRMVDDAPDIAPGSGGVGSPRLIIGLSGLAGSGKSTAAHHLIHRHGFARVRFAGPLKSMMAALGLTQEQIEGSEKEKPCALLAGKTPRYAMQTIGTEWGRDLIAPDLWIRAWQAAVDALPPGQPVVCDDVRFPNEADAIRAAGGFLVRVERPGAGAGAAGHSSEEQDLGVPTATMQNTDSIPFLGRLVDALVRDLSWIDNSAVARHRERDKPHALSAFG